MSVARWRKYLAVGAIAGLLLPSTVAMAQGRGHRGGQTAQARGFDDLGSVPWAVPGITAMQAQGVLQGVGTDSFDPNGLLTRAQMATVLGRLFGWKSGAASTTTPFADSGSIPSYAQPYVSMAAQQGILQGEPGNRFDPGGNMTWAQLAVAVARAYRYPQVATDQVATWLAELPNGSGTPSWATQAVAQDVQAGDFSGSIADLYQPGADVTRAELATFLYQVEQQAAAGSGAPTTAGTGDVVSGTVSAVGSDSLTLATTSGGSQSIALSPTVSVFASGIAASLSAVQVGDDATVVLAGGQGVVIDITGGATASAGTSLTGTVAAVQGDELQLTLAGLPTLSLPIAANVGVTQAGVASSLAAVLPGETVGLTLNTSGQVTGIAIAGGLTPTTGASSTATTTAAGTVQSLTGDVLQLVLGDGASQSFTLSPDVTVNGSANDIAAVTVGDTVDLTLSGGLVTDIEIVSSAGSSAVDTSLTGTVAAVTGGLLSLTPSGMPTLELPLAGDVSVTQAGSDVGIGAVTPGETVSVALNGSGQVTAIAVVSAATTTTTSVSGTVGSLSGDVLQLAVEGGGSQTYTLSPDVTVDGQAGDLGAVAAGDGVTLTLDGGDVAAIEIDAAANSTTAATPPPGVGLMGTVASVDGSQLGLTVFGRRTFELTLAAADVSVTQAGAASSLSAVVPGEMVSVTLAGGQVDAIAILGTAAAGTSVATGTVQSLSGNDLQLQLGNASSQSFTLSPDVTVNGSANNLAAVAAGDTVSLISSGGVVGDIEVLGTPNTTPTPQTPPSFGGPYGSGGWQQGGHSGGGASGGSRQRRWGGW